jgi:hypothetical protein
MKKLNCNCEFLKDGKCLFNETTENCELQINKAIVKEIISNIKK